MDLNRLQIIGNLTRDCELRQTDQGAQYTSFSVATNYRYKKKNSEEYEEEATFFDCIAWGKLAETIASMGKKGKRVYIDGRMKQRTYETENGEKRTRYALIVENFIMLSKKDSYEMSHDEAADFMGGEVLPESV